MNASDGPRLLSPNLLRPKARAPRSGMRAWLLAALCALLSVSCHRATEQECEQILDRIVELELRERGVTDPEAIKRRTEETKAKKREALIQSCVGKRISAANMQCIREAPTAADITDKCLR
jgi:hypothetical protein